jgi:hypothetical protein
VTGQRQVAPGAVEHEVEEEGAAGAGERADEVVLPAQRDQDVLDAVVQAQGRQSAGLGPYDLGVAGRGDLQVEPAFSSADPVLADVLLAASAALTIPHVTSK